MCGSPCLPPILGTGLSSENHTSFSLTGILRHHPGHLSNAATVLAELAECMDAQKLVSIAHLVRLPDVQRLGYVLDVLGEGNLAGPLSKWLDTRRPRAIPLRPGEPANVEVDPRWHVLPNEELELDH